MLIITSLFLSAQWAIFFSRLSRKLLRIPVWEDEPEASLSPASRLSILVPARNQADEIEETVLRLVAQDYPAREILVIDDRSVDATGAIVGDLKNRMPGVQLLTLTELPSGWLGKVNALHRGIQATDGDFILMIDADVRLEPSVARKIVARMEAHGLDHLTILPRIVSKSPVARALGLAAIWGLFDRFLATFGARTIGHRDAIGIGPLNCVRRSALARTPGMEWLKGEVLDDVGLGFLCREYGLKSGLYLSRSDVTMPWYESFAELNHGLEKNIFSAMAGLSLRRAAGAVALQTLFALTPFAFFAFALFGAPMLPQTLVGAGFLVSFALVASGRHDQPFWIGLVFPLSVAFLTAHLARSAILASRRNAIEWRGTWYPLKQLRDGQRIR